MVKHEHNRNAGETESGATLVEFALMVLVLMLIFMGMFDLGFAAYTYNSISLAAREGARYALICTRSDSDVVTWVQGEAVGLDWSNPINTVQVVSTPSSPDVDHPECSDGFRPHFAQVTVTVDYTYQPFTTLILQALGVSGLTLRAQSTMVVE